MYCTKCGKEIESGIICDACIEKEREQIAESPATEKIEHTVFESVSDEQAEKTVFDSVNEEPAVVALDETLWQPAYEALVVDAPNKSVNDSPMLGFGRALASTIIGVFASIFGLIVYIFAIMGDSIAESDPDEALALLFAAVILIVVFTLPLAIISLVMGSKSITLFKKTVGKKPIATLILGIVGVYHAAGAFLMLLESLFYL